MQLSKRDNRLLNEFSKSMQSETINRIENWLKTPTLNADREPCITFKNGAQLIVKEERVTRLKPDGKRIRSVPAREFDLIAVSPLGGRTVIRARSFDEFVDRVIAFGMSA
jgi:hypothetical protein